MYVFVRTRTSANILVREDRYVYENDLFNCYHKVRLEPKKANILSYKKSGVAYWGLPETTLKTNAPFGLLSQLVREADS